MNKTIIAGMLTAMFLVGGAASAAEQSTAARVIDDSAITTKVKAALVEDKDVHALKVHVKTYKGQVQLNGYVETDEQKQSAEAVASKVEGVTSVQNNLKVGKVHHSLGKAIDDTAITTKVKAAFAGSSAVKATQINVDTKGGVVTLSGFADNAAEKSEAERLAHQVKHVHRVVNNIELRN